MIGAGIAGLVTAKVLRGDGFDVSVFEKESAIGGVWAPTRTYPGLRANNARESYAFSDHPHDGSVDEFRRAEQIRQYFCPFWPSRYGTLADERRRARQVATTSK